MPFYRTSGIKYSHLTPPVLCIYTYNEYYICMYTIYIFTVVFVIIHIYVSSLVCMCSQRHKCTISLESLK